MVIIEHRPSSKKHGSQLGILAKKWDSYATFGVIRPLKRLIKRGTWFWNDNVQIKTRENLNEVEFYN